MKKVLLSRSQLLATMLLILAVGSVLCGINPVKAFNQADVTSIGTVEDANILTNGDAQLTLVVSVPSLLLADMYRKMLAVPSDIGVGEQMPIPENKTENGGVVPVKQEFYKSIKQEQENSFGFATRILNSSMVPMDEQGEFRVSIDAYASLQVVNFTAQGSSGIWEIVVGPKDENATIAAAGYALTTIAFAKQMLQSLEGGQEYEASKTLRLKLPEGATLLNSDELGGLSWTVSFGGGTFMSASVSVDDPSTVVLDERTVVTEENVTAAPAAVFDAFSGYGVFKIRYLLPESTFGGSESGLTSDSDWSCGWDWPWHEDFPIEWDSEDGTLEAILTISPSFELSGYLGWDFDWHAGLNWFEAWIGASASLAVKLEVKATRGPIDTYWEETVFDYRLYRWTFAIDWVPVWIDLDLSVIPTLTVSADGPLDFSVGLVVGASFKGGLRYDDGWSIIKESNTYAYVTGPTMYPEAGLSIEPSVKVRVAFMVYSVAGPYVEVQPYINGAIEPITEDLFTWKVTVGFRLNVGITFVGWLKSLLGLRDYWVTVLDLAINEWDGHWGQAPSYISIDSISPSPTYVGGGIMINGAISSQYSGNLFGTVVIEYSTDVAFSWIDGSSTTQPSPSGEYSLWMVLWEPGVYHVRSRWDGNSDFKGATSDPKDLLVSAVVSGAQWIAYDDYGGEGGQAINEPKGAAVLFTPPVSPWILQAIKICAQTDDRTSPVYVKIWDDQGHELFSSSYIYDYVFPPGIGYIMSNIIDIPDIIVSGNFYIAVSGPPPATIGIGVDYNSPRSGRSYFVNMDTDSITYYYDNVYWSHGNFMIYAGGVSLVEDHYMYKWVVGMMPSPSGGFEPVNIKSPTDTFNIDDDYAYSYVKFRPVIGTFVTDTDVYWVWDTPDGILYDVYWQHYTASWDGNATAREPIKSNRLFYEQYLGRPFKVEAWIANIGTGGVFINALNETFRVIKYETKMSIASSSNSITYGQNVQISSQLTPSLSDGKTTLQYSNDQIGWNNIASDTPLGGYYSFNWMPPHARTYYLRAVWSGDSDYCGNTSSTITLTVNPAPTSLTTTLSAYTIIYGTSIIVITSMMPALQGRNVTFQYSLDDSTWYYLNLTTTDSTGKNATSWAPPLAGAYYIRSTWYGDADYLGANSTSLKLTVQWAPLSTQVEIASGANAEVDRTPNATVEFAVKVKDQKNGKYINGIGVVEFYVSDYSRYHIVFAGSDNDSNKDGIYNITWTANANWPTLGPQHWSAWFTGTPDYNESLTSTDFTIYYYGIAIWMDPTFQAVNVTQSETYSINFEWNHDPIDTYDLSLKGLDPSWYTLSQTSITPCPVGQTEQVALTISPPKVATILKDYDFTVTAAYQTSFSVAASATLRVDFKPTPPASPTGGLVITVQPKTTYTSAGKAVSVNLVVVNNQNFDDNITVDIRSSGIPNPTWFEWLRVKVYIPAGDSISLPLEIEVPQGTPFGTYDFRAVVTSRTNFAMSTEDSGTICLADTTPPITTISLNGISGSNGWYRSDVAITFTATDDLSGIASTEYSFDGTDWIPYTIQITISSEGTTTIYYRSIDNAGNLEIAKSQTINIDKTAPTLTKSLSGTLGSNDWYFSDVTVTLTSVDTGGSGLASVEYNLNNAGWTSYTGPFAISTEGTNTLEHRATDNAGNVYVLTSQTIKIDKTKPATTLTIGSPKSGTNPTYVSTTTQFTLSATDSIPGSGIDYAEYKFTSHNGNGASWTTYVGLFTAPGTGSYDLYYISVDKAGNIETPKSEWVIIGATSLTYTGDAKDQYSDPVALSSTLNDLATNSPISGKIVTFTIGTQTATGTTDALGVATASITLNQPSGSYTVTASFAGDSNYQPSTDSKPFTINTETVTITYTGDTLVFTARPTISTAPVHLSAHLNQEADGYLGDLTLATVTFALFKSTNTGMTTPDLTFNVAVSSSGDALTTTTLPVDVWTVKVTVQSNNKYWTQSSEAIGVLTVGLGSAKQSVFGGGWIHDSMSANGKAYFCFMVTYVKNSAPKGCFVYFYRGTDGYDYIIKSTSWQGGGLSFTGTNKAYFTGKCSILIINPATGKLVRCITNCKFAVDITDGDLSTPRTTDMIAITVFDSSGAIWRQIGTPTAEIPLGWGNIIIYSK